MIGFELVYSIDKCRIKCLKFSQKCFQTCDFIIFKQISVIFTFHWKPIHFSFISLWIQLARLHIECFKEKLSKLETASRNIKKNGKKWNLDDIRNNIEVAFHTAWRIRLSQDVPEKQEFAKQMSSIVGTLRANYVRKKVCFRFWIKC